MFIHCFSELTKYFFMNFRWNSIQRLFFWFCGKYLFTFRSAFGGYVIILTRNTSDTRQHFLHQMVLIFQSWFKTFRLVISDLIWILKIFLNWFELNLHFGFLQLIQIQTFYHRPQINLKQILLNNDF